jgi:hypothetical protein
MSPINYTAMQVNPQDALMQGVKTGLTFDAIAQQAQQQEIAIQQQKQALTAQQALQDVLSNPNATPAMYGAVSAMNPKFRESIKDQWDRLDTAKQQSFMGDTSRMFSALQSGRGDIALQLAETQLKAAENAGDQEKAKQLRTFRDMIEKAPDVARTMIGSSIAALPGGDKYFSSMKTGGDESRAAALAPSELAIKVAEARTKGVEAKNAPTRVGLENQTAEEKILSERNKREIDRLNVEIGQADSETKRGQLILERDKLMATQVKDQTTATTGAQDAMDVLNSSMNTVKSIQEHPGIKSVIGMGGVGSITGKLSGLIPGSDRKDLEGLVDTLKSQQFLAGIKQMTGMGALSNAEGEKIGAAVASLNLDQSLNGFNNAIGVIKSNLERAQAKQVASGKLPTNGGAFIMKHPVYGNVTEGNINTLLSKFPGASRAQVLEYLDKSANPVNQIPGR